MPGAGISQREHHDVSSLNTTGSRMQVNLTAFLALSMAWLSIAWFISNRVSDAGLWLACLGTLILALPILAMGLYSSTVAKILRSQAYRSGTWLHRFRTRRLFSTILWTLFSLTAGFCSLFWFGQMGPYEWALVVLSIPVFLWLHRLFFGALGSQYKVYIAVERSLRASRWVYAALMATLMVALGSFLDDGGTPTRLTELMLENQSRPLELSRSVLVQYAVRYAEYYHQVKAIGISSVRHYDTMLPLLLSLIGSFGIYFSIAVAFSGFCIPAREYRRIVLPVQDTGVPGVPGRSRVVFASAVITVVAVFLYLPGMAGIEGWLKNDPAVREKIAEAEAAALPHFEKIEDRLFKPGTIEEIRELQLELIGQYEANLQKIVPLAENGYRSMRNNVDGYLDWYYSLPAEYLRLASLLTASLEDSIKADLTESLEKGDPFEDVERAMDAMIVENAELKARFDSAVARVMSDNEVVAELPEFNISEHISMAEMTSPVKKIETIDIKLRAAGAGVGAVTGIVTAKVVSKAVAKGTVKLAAKAITKAAVSKGASAGAGAGAGALLGSFVPGAGTLVGAAIGATVGLVVGVSVDALLLKVEEVLSRDDFKREILSSIEATRISFYDNLGLPAP